jgi:hypothetical protein
MFKGDPLVSPCYGEENYSRGCFVHLSFAEFTKTETRTRVGSADMKTNLPQARTTPARTTPAAPTQRPAQTFPTA